MKRVAVKNLLYPPPLLLVLDRLYKRLYDFTEFRPINVCIMPQVIDRYPHATLSQKYRKEETYGIGQFPSEQSPSGCSM